MEEKQNREMHSHTADGCCGQKQEAEQHSAHTHEHGHPGQPVPSVHIYTHGTASVGSVKCRIAGEYEEALEKLKSCMKATAGAVEKAGGLIGHLKAFVREESRTCMISMTDGEEMQCRTGSACGIYAEAANIVFGVPPELLEEILKHAYQEHI